MFVLPSRMPRRGPARLAAVLMTFAFVAMSGPIAHADLMKFSYSGTITSADASTGVTPGATISGTFAYNPTGSVATNTYPGNASYVSGQTLMTPQAIADGSGLTVNVGGKSIYSNTSGVNVAVTQFEFAGQYGFAAGPSTTVAITNLNVDSAPVLVSLELTSPYKALYPSLASPAMLKLSDFSSAIISVYDFTGGVQSSLLYRGTIDTMLPAPAPEPSTVIILGVAVAGWFARSRRRSA
jgi:hypothetical protein